MRLEQQVLTLGRHLRARDWQLATAESCTGGGIAAACTSVAGSSDWFAAGLVTYIPAMKQRLLRVPARLIERYGVVSEPVARAMAEGAMAATGADLTVAVTGIAGPGGGEVLQPVGTVWFGWAGRGSSEVVTAVEQFQGGREAVRQATVARALEGAIAWLEADHDAGG